MPAILGKLRPDKTRQNMTFKALGYQKPRKSNSIAYPLSSACACIASTKLSYAKLSYAMLRYAALLQVKLVRAKTTKLNKVTPDEIILGLAKVNCLRVVFLPIQLKLN